jgi:hypothetical protein
MVGKYIMDKNKEPARTTFAKDTKMTPGIVELLMDIVRVSVTSFKERQEASQKYFDMLSNNRENPPQR